jgi:hypothetical protein
MLATSIRAPIAEVRWTNGSLSAPLRPKPVADTVAQAIEPAAVDGTSASLRLASAAGRAVDAYGSTSLPPA